MVIVFLIIGILYFVTVFVLKGKLIYKEKKSIVLKKDIAPLISTLLFHKKKASREQKADFVNAKVQLQEMLKNPRNRKVISEILMDIQTDLSGTTRQRLVKIYKDFGLHSHAIKKLGNWRWEVVCRGITELTDMQVGDSYGFIRKFINDRRGIVRKQAQLATVALKHEGINYFLDTSTHKISEWQQLKLIEVLHDLQDFTPPRFRLWLTSKNKDVVLFAVRLIKSFKQDDALESLLKLVKHRDDQIKVEAIDCMREFEYDKALPLFKAIFWNCRSEVKLSLLTAIGELGNTSDIPFLKQVEDRASDFMIKSKAIGTINALAPESILPTDEINESLDDLPVQATEIPPSQDASGEEKATEHDEVHHEFEASLKSPIFQKYDEESQEEELAYDLIFDEDLLDIAVIAEEVQFADDYFVLGQDTFGDLDDTDLPNSNVLTKTAEQIQVEYKILDTSPDYQKVDDFEASSERVTDTGFEEDLLHFAAISEITDHANYEYEEEDEEDMSLDEIRNIHIVYNEVSANAAASDILEPYFEMEWPVEDQEKVGYSLGTGTIDFDLEFYPASFEKKMKSRQRLWKKYEKQEESGESYSSAFEKLFYASDRDGKLLLLDDILRLGDERDLLFLKKLQDDKSNIIRKCADRITKQLTKQLYPEEDPETTEIPENESNPDLEPAFGLAEEEEVMEKGDQGEEGGKKPPNKKEEGILFDDTVRRIQRSMKK